MQVKDVSFSSETAVGQSEHAKGSSPGFIRGVNEYEILTLPRSSPSSLA